MATKNFLDLPGLTTYDEEIKRYITSHSGGTNTEIIADYCIVSRRR